MPKETILEKLPFPLSVNMYIKAVKRVMVLKSILHSNNNCKQVTRVTISIRLNVS